jgi:hypothetical protein
MPDELAIPVEYEDLNELYTNVEAGASYGSSGGTCTSVSGCRGMGDCTKDLYYFPSHIECQSVFQV